MGDKRWYETKIYASVGELEKKLKEDPLAYSRYVMMDDDWKQKFVDFCMGKKTLPLLYDNSFKLVFNTDIHADRLGDFISQIIGRNVEVLVVLPIEESFMAGDKIVIMDIIVRLDDGSIANVEIHKNPYTFAGERVSCYSSDLLLRQYSQLKSKKGKNFKYNDLKQVYTIVIYEKTTKEFHQHKPAYIHHGEMTFDTGLKLNMLQHSYLIALDTFRECGYDMSQKGTQRELGKLAVTCSQPVSEANFEWAAFPCDNLEDKSRLTGWLSLLVTEDIDDAIKNVERFPWLEEIYSEIAELRGRPGEVVSMYSNWIMELDNNSIQFIVDEQKAEIEERKRLMEEQKTLMEEQQVEIEERKALMEEQKTLMEEQQAEIENLKVSVETRDEELVEKDKKLAEQSARIRELERQLTGIKN
jgi:hypothetical protein